MKPILAFTLTAFVFASQVCAEESGKDLTPPPHYGQIPKAGFGDLRGGFAQPDMIYAPFAFWFWDEPLDAVNYPAKAGDMARMMMEQRMNPGYAHPRLSGADIFPGVFCDTEGSYGNNGSGIPWSDDLAEHYQAETGRDVKLWRPLMFDDDAEGISARARVDWFNAMSDLYSGFHGEINDWVEQHGMYYIANLWEKSLQWQTTMLGDYMKNMREFSMPGTDCLALKANDARDFKETQTITLPDFKGDLVLDLGMVNHIAEVWVNGLAVQKVLECSARIFPTWVLGKFAQPSLTGSPNANIFNLK